MTNNSNVEPYDCHKLSMFLNHLHVKRVPGGCVTSDRINAEGWWWITIYGQKPEFLLIIRQIKDVTNHHLFCIVKYHWQYISIISILFIYFLYAFIVKKSTWCFKNSITNSDWFCELSMNIICLEEEKEQTILQFWPLKSPLW